MRLKISAILSMTVALAIAGCGGSDKTGVSTATGQFKDSNTSGLTYTSGAQTGITGADGGFTYEAGKSVTFKIGGVTLGTATGKAVVTPIDLATNGTSATDEVRNRVRFLMMLDNDGVVTNGINISSAVQAAATMWSQLDFSTTESGFTAAVSGIQATVSAADTRSAILPSAVTAQSHLESTLRCTYAGAYKGTFAGDDSGQFGVLVDALSGSVSGVAFSNGTSSPIGLTGVSPISYDQNVAFVSGSTSTGATFSGKYTSVSGVSGTWSNTSPLANGTFSGARIGGASNALYRFTGQYSGSDSGLMTFDIDSANKVTGVGYSVPSNTLFTVTGSLVSGSGALTGTASTGAIISATINTSAGTISSGNWSNIGASGTFTGSGCKLN